MRRSPAHVLLAVAIATTGVLLASCSSSSSSDGDAAATTTNPATTTTAAADYADLDASDIAFHPVLAIVSCDGGAVPGATVATTADAAPSSTVPAVDGALCYVLGPEGGNGSQVRDAKVYADGVGIEVSVREDDVASMNLLFNACYLAIAACPASSAEGKGYVAVVVDGKVVSTPAIDEEDLASSPFVITGDFDQRQAADIATAINDR